MGSYNSATGSSVPPMMITFPFARSVAVCWALHTRMLPVIANALVVGSYTSARVSADPPVIRTFPFGNRVAVWFDLGTAIDPVAVNTPGPTAALTTTEACLVSESPAALVTVKVKVVLAVKTPVGTPPPLVTNPMLLSMLPVPPVKMPFSWVRVPTAMVERSAVKLVMTGRGTTVTVTSCETEVPAASVTVNL